MTRVLAALLLAVSSIGWLDPHARARDAARLFAEGKFEDAATRYHEALVDDPDSPLLHFNLGDALYRQGKWEDALHAFGRVPATEAAPGRAARVAYNVGNTKYRMGEAAAPSDPRAALALWGEALVAYRRALGTDPADVDAKFNHELVARKIAELKKKLEEQQKEQEQQQQEQQEQQEQEKQEEQNRQEQNQEQQEQQEQGQQPPQPGEQQQASAPPQPDPSGAPEPPAERENAARPDDRPGGARGDAATAGERHEGTMTPEDAAALLDAQRAQEARPDEVTRRLQGAVVGEPAEDW